MEAVIMQYLFEKEEMSNFLRLFPSHGMKGNQGAVATLFIQRLLEEKYDISILCFGKLSKLEKILYNPAESLYTFQGNTLSFTSEFLNGNDFTIRIEMDNITVDLENWVVKGYRK